jgi:hypothetical protein
VRARRTASQIRARRGRLPGAAVIGHRLPRPQQVQRLEAFVQVVG